MSMARSCGRMGCVLCRHGIGTGTVSAGSEEGRRELAQS